MKVGDIRGSENKKYVRFTSPYFTSETRYKEFTVQAIVSCVNVFMSTSNIEQAQLDIPIVTNLEGHGYCSIYTTNTDVDDDSVISILLFQGDVING